MTTTSRQRWLLGVVVVVFIVAAITAIWTAVDAMTRAAELETAERALSDAGVDISSTRIGAEDVLACNQARGPAIYDHAAGSGHRSEYEAVVRFAANGLQRAEFDWPSGLLAPGPGESQWTFTAADGTHQVVYDLSEFDGRFVVGTTSPC